MLKAQKIAYGEKNITALEHMYKATCKPTYELFSGHSINETPGNL